MLQLLQSYLEKGNKYTIVFSGDSLVSCEWVHPNWREIVEYVLKEELQKTMPDWKTPTWGIRCINSGFDGATSLDILDRVEEDILVFKPAMVMFILGGNDKYFTISPQQHVKNCDALLKRVQEECKHVVFCTSLFDNDVRFSDAYAPYAQAVRELFPRDGVTFIDLFSLYKPLDRDKLYTFITAGIEEFGIKPGALDPVHPNQLGNAYIAKFVLEAVFSVPFDPKVYIRDTLAGKMLPSY